MKDNVVAFVVIASGDVIVGKISFWRPLSFFWDPVFNRIELGRLVSLDNWLRAAWETRHEDQPARGSRFPLLNFFILFHQHVCPFATSSRSSSRSALQSSMDLKYSNMFSLLWIVNENTLQFFIGQSKCRHCRDGTFSTKHYIMYPEFNWPF